MYQKKQKNIDKNSLNNRITYRLIIVDRELLKIKVNNLNEKFDKILIF
jgi:hypothetical protein